MNKWINVDLYGIGVGSGWISGLMWILFEVRWINVDIFLGEAGGCGFLWVRGEDSGWMWMFYGPRIVVKRVDVLAFYGHIYSGKVSLNKWKRK